MLMSQSSKSCRILTSVFSVKTSYNEIKKNKTNTNQKTTTVYQKSGTKKKTMTFIYQGKPKILLLLEKVVCKSELLTLVSKE